MPPKEVMKTKLSTAGINISEPREDVAHKNPVNVSGTAVVRMKATESVGGGAERVTEFPVTENFTITVRSGGEELPALISTRAGKMTWRLTRLFRFSEGEHRITARLKGSVTEIHTEVDLHTGKVLRDRAKTKVVNQSDSIRIRVRLAGRQ